MSSRGESSKLPSIPFYRGGLRPRGRCDSPRPTAISGGIGQTVALRQCQRLTPTAIISSAILRNLTRVGYQTNIAAMIGGSRQNKETKKIYDKVKETVIQHLLTNTSCAPGGKAATMLVTSAAWHVFEHMDRRSAISPKRGELLGKSCILPPGSVGGYPSPEEPPTPETSEDILRREMLMLTTRLVVQSVCRD